MIHFRERKKRRDRCFETNKSRYAPDNHLVSVYPLCMHGWEGKLAMDFTHPTYSKNGRMPGAGLKSYIEIINQCIRNEHQPHPYLRERKNMFFELDDGGIIPGKDGAARISTNIKGETRNQMKQA